ncbi:DUF2125 domain-containing protein [Wenxinia marina]|uniref:DUF2125 domain-containing protein n=1 Tax=Wenxinia marina DSM 24838 TaxID=1123501 RepID=A0A0D0PGA6_9RHOB|nr:DUF2125 domain-containing protein [Wenxinia marina]KIQ70386.1 Uncharacterized protein Wenmar_00762 [Wenxinia marina DSM 24838]GGL53596.1 hypothetical protein GCM10011392_04910 [Wenxinia marina]
MKASRILGTTVSAAALAWAGAAAADVTAEQVWEMWQTNLDMYGEGMVTYDEPTMSGGSLTVPNLAIAMSTPDSSIEAPMGDLVFTENGDGTVDVAFPEEFTMTFSPGPAITETDRAVVAVRVGDSTLTVSGTPEEMTFDISAPRYEIELEEVIVEGQPMQAEALLGFTNTTGTYTMREGDLREVDYDLSMDNVDILIDATAPEGEEGAFFLSGQFSDLAFDASVAIPPDMDMNAPPEEMAMVFQQGLAMSGGYSFGSGTYMFNFSDGMESGEGTASVGSGELTASFDASALSYNTRVTDLALNISSSELPFPIELSAAEYGLGLSMPLESTDEPADFSASVNLTDVTVNDMIWSMIDPSGQLPHDPATIVIGLSGTARLLFDVLDPAQAEQMATADMPAELHSLTLDELNVSLVGAQLTGGGSFTFDNSDMTTFPGMPRPQGELGISLTGGNGLLDTLVEMGLVPQDAAMQGRMMMGMFATVTGDDQLETTVEVNDQGHLIVNGQRLQ